MHTCSIARGYKSLNLQGTSPQYSTVIASDALLRGFVRYEQHDVFFSKISYAFASCASHAVSFAVVFVRGKVSLSELLLAPEAKSNDEFNFTKQNLIA